MFSQFLVCCGVGNMWWPSYILMTSRRRPKLVCVQPKSDISTITKLLQNFIKCSKTWFSSSKEVKLSLHQILDILIGVLWLFKRMPISSSLPSTVHVPCPLKLQIACADCPVGAKENPSIAFGTQTKSRLLYLITLSLSSISSIVQMPQYLQKSHYTPFPPWTRHPLLSQQHDGLRLLVRILSLQPILSGCGDFHRVVHPNNNFTLLPTSADTYLVLYSISDWRLL